MNLCRLFSSRDKKIKVLEDKVLDDKNSIPDHGSPKAVEREMLQRILWERAKGELYGMVAICRSKPLTKHCQDIENQLLDSITSIDDVIYEWTPPKRK